MDKSIINNFENELRRFKAFEFINNNKDNLDIILNNSTIKNKLAQKLFNESIIGNVGKYYQNFIDNYGINLLIMIYNHNTIDKLIDEEDMRYIIIAVMLENDVNLVLNYALSDKQFLNILKEYADEYYSLLRKIDYNIISKYIEECPNFTSRYFTIEENQMKKILINPELPLPILTSIISNIQDIKILSWFFHNVPSSYKVFHCLSRDTIKRLITNKVSLPKRILSCDYLFDSIKEESVVNIRKIANRIIDNYGYIEIDNKIEEYYKKIMPERNKKLADLIVDYLFRDDIYNVFINLKEILSYHKSLDKKILSDEVIEFFKMILNIDNLSKEEKMNIFNKYYNKKVYLLYYDSLYKLKKHVYERLHDSLTIINSNNKIIDLRDSRYLLLVRSMNSLFDKKTNNRRDCYSIISNNHNEVFYGKYIYGYNYIDINKIIHMYEHDAFSHQNDGNNTTNYINRLYQPKELIKATSKVNEIQILNEKIENDYIAMIPNYIIAIDEVTEDIIQEGNRLNIPIVLISSCLKENISIINDMDIESRVLCNSIESIYSPFKYTDDRGITNLEEKIRVKERFSR